MSRTRTDLFTHDLSPAETAGVALVVVGAQILLKRAGLAVDADIAVDRGTHKSDCFLKQSLDVSVQFDQFPSRWRTGQPPRMNAGSVQRFVGIDVAQTGDEGLVQQGRLEHARPTTTQLHEIIRRNIQRLWTQRCQSFLLEQFIVRIKPQTAAPALVIEA